MTIAEKNFSPTPGDEVIVIGRDHPQFNQIGTFVGMTHALGVARARVRIDGAVYLCDPADLVEN